MKTTIVNCDFCPAVIHDGAYYEFRTCDMSQAVQICPRCMAIFGDEVRKKRMKE